MKGEEVLLILLLLVGAYLAVITKNLTPAGSLVGSIIGWLLYLGASYTGVAMMGAFFILGTAATLCQISEKEQSAIAEKRGGQRNAYQVFANAGVAAIAGVLCVLFPAYNILFRLAMASALSSATADTLSSELGNVYGKRFYNVLSFRKDTRGMDGVISLEGTMAGFGGSILIALIFMIGWGWHLPYFVIVVISGTVGNIADSILGARFERKGLLQNNTVNFLNTLLAAIAACILYPIFL